MKRSIFKELWIARKTFITILTPVLLLPIGLKESSISRCAYGVAVMAIYWITESIPIPATALLPIILFPLLGVLPVKDVCRNYIKDVSMFGFGCLSFAIAVEKWNLHKRIALKTLLFMGSNPKWLMLGFMLPTWFLSMWVNNSSATAMMLPIVNAVLDQLRDTGNNQKSDGDEIVPLQDYIQDEQTEPGSEMQKEETPSSKEPKIGEREKSAEFRRLCKGMSLCVAYAANIGGTGSLSGSSPNLIMKGQMDMLFEEKGLESGVTFTTWLIFALPGSILCLFLAWQWLALIYIGRSNWCQWKCSNSDADSRVRSTIRDQYKALGPLTFAEKGILFHFLLLIGIWLSRKPPMAKGWGAYFPYAGDAVAAILISVSLYVFPAKMPNVFCLRKKHTTASSVPSLLDWKSVELKYPWGVLMLLLGGGFALANVCQKSGLSEWVGEELRSLNSLQPWVLNLILTSLVSLCTEITSNSATSALLLPIVAQLALNVSINPLYVTWSCTIAASFAFMLPVATASNAIVFAYGYLEVKDMITTGFVMNILGLIVLNVAANTWGDAYFDFKTVPPEFYNNATSFLDVVNITLPT